MHAETLRKEVGEEWEVEDAGGGDVSLGGSGGIGTGSGLGRRWLLSIDRESTGTGSGDEPGPGPGPGDCRERLLPGIEGKVEWEIIEDSYCYAPTHLIGTL